MTPREKDMALQDKHLRDNLLEIDSLSQRGGRMLSLVDLVLAGTVSAELAGELAFAALSGASFITAAGPGGVGKTTLMAALLGLVPPGARVRIVASARDIHRAESADGLTYHVVHEIGSGHYLGYLWGEAVGRYVGLISPADRIASNVHANTMAEALEQLEGSPLSVERERLAGVDLWLFMKADGGFATPRRRVVSVWTSNGEQFEETWRLDARRDMHVRCSDGPVVARLGSGRGGNASSSADRVAELTRLLERLAEERVVALEDVRRSILDGCDD